MHSQSIIYIIDNILYISLALWGYERYENENMRIRIWEFDNKWLFRKMRFLVDGECLKCKEQSNLNTTDPLLTQLVATGGGGYSGCWCRWWNLKS